MLEGEILKLRHGGAFWGTEVFHRGRNAQQARGFGAGGLLVMASSSASAQTYPTKPIRFVVPFAAGGGSDLVARTVAAKLTEALGQSVIVDNRAGAAGTIGADIAAKAPADGHTLLLGSNGPLAINPTLYAKLPYDAARDFAPVTLVTVMPFLLVTHPSLPVRSVKELIALAKARPGQLNYGSPGTGATTHLANELFKSMTGVDITHVPYKGVAPAAIDLISGQRVTMSGGWASGGAASSKQGVHSPGLRRAAQLFPPTARPSPKPAYPVTKRAVGLACWFPPERRRASWPASIPK